MYKFLIVLIIFAGCGPDSDPVDTNDQNNLNSDNNANNGENQNVANNQNNENNENNENNANNANNENNMGTNDPDTVPMTMIFESAFEETGCTAGYCHGGAVDGLVINTAEVSIDAMVNVTSIRPACGLTKLVVPGDPEQSLLWMRVRPEALDEGEPCVAKMPKGTSGLSEEKAALIYDWIASGAQL